MVCDQTWGEGQTLSQRKEEVREAVLRLQRALVAGLVRPRVGIQGAIAFEGWQDRRGISDACAYRLIMSQGSALAKQQIAKAEAASGRAVDRKAVNAKVHSHDGGRTWHKGH